jgi:hypothetical protein
MYFLIIDITYIIKIMLKYFFFIISEKHTIK